VTEQRLRHRHRVARVLQQPAHAVPQGVGRRILDSDALGDPLEHHVYGAAIADGSEPGAEDEVLPSSPQLGWTSQLLLGLHRPVLSEDAPGSQVFEVIEGIVGRGDQAARVIKGKCREVASDKVGLPGVDAAPIIVRGIAEYVRGKIQTGDSVAALQSVVRQLAGASPRIEHLVARTARGQALIEPDDQRCDPVDEAGPLLTARHSSAWQSAHAGQLCWWPGAMPRRTCEGQARRHPCSRPAGSAVW
jgi:hypothetical protein